LKQAAIGLGALLGAYLGGWAAWVFVHQDSFQGKVAVSWVGMFLGAIVGAILTAALLGLFRR
jgi:hypothetical protein